MTNETQHLSHPVRNFFYILLSLLHLAAFLGFFYALVTPTLPYRDLLLSICIAILAFALLFFFFVPFLRRGGE